MSFVFGNLYYFLCLGMTAVMLVWNLHGVYTGIRAWVEDRKSMDSDDFRYWSVNVGLATGCAGVLILELLRWRHVL